jgi:DbpA-like RNA binding protein
MGDRIARPCEGTQPLPFRVVGGTMPRDTRPLTTEDRVTVADAKAALERGRPVVLVRPPAVEQAADLWGLISPATPGHGPGVGLSVLIICADDASAAEWAAAAPAGWRVHAVSGLARTTRLLKDRPVDVLAGSVAHLAVLVQRAALKLDRVASVVVAWPETLVTHEHAPALDALLAEARDARRIVLSWNPGALGDFLERHARRALVVGTPAVDDTGASLRPVCRARYAIVPSFRRSVAVRDALDTLNAMRPLIWDGGPIAPAAGTPPPDAVLCLRLPSRDELQTLAALGGGGAASVTLFVSAAQLAYLRTIAAPLTPLPLPGAADRALDRAEALRARVAALLETENVEAELALLTPLFERYDPAEVAAALLRIGHQPPATGGSVPATAAPPGRIKVFVNVGKKDRAGPKDLVGALIREVGLEKNAVGKIEVRETFSIVEVAAGEAERVVRALTGVTIRGRRVAARLDRER